MQEYLNQLDPNLEYIGHEVIGDRIVIEARSREESAACTCCGEPSSRKHSQYVRVVDDLPFGDKRVTIKLTVRKMFCANAECTKKTFAEPFDFLGPKAKKTNRLIDRVLDIGSKMNTVEAAETIKRTTADIDRTTVSNLLKKNMPEVDRESVRYAGIDDFAKRKRFDYGTIMVNHENGKTVDILDSRDPQKVREWLASFPNLELVTRDNSSLYRAALNEATEAVQVADTFHMIKLLGGALMGHIGKHLPANFGIPGSQKPQLGSGNTYFDKKPKGRTAKQKKADEKRRQREELHQEILRMKEKENLKGTEIARKLGVPVSRVYTYLSPDFSAQDKRTGTRRTSPVIGPFARRIIVMLGEGSTLKEVYEAICAAGYEGSYEALAAFATSERRKMWQDGVVTERIERTMLKTHLLNPKRSGLSPEQVERINELYPRFGKCLDIMEGFRDLFRKGDIDAVAGWVEQALELGSASVESVINGLKRDWDAFLAAICLDYSNGPTEGKVRKLKVKKAESYGNAPVPLLKAKILLVEAA